MKTFATTLLGITIGLLSINLSFSQSDFEGTITYDIEYSNLPDQPGIENMIPSEMKISIKGKKTCVEQLLGTSGGKNIIVSDYENMNGFLAMNTMGQKMLILIDEKSFKENIEENREESFEKLEGTKEILGHTCQKAKINAEGTEIIVYYSENLPNKMGQEMMNLPGMPLEYNITLPGMNMTFVANNIDESSVDASIFEKPEGYQEMDLETLKSMGMGDIKF